MRRCILAAIAGLVVSSASAVAAALPPAPAASDSFDVGMLHVERYGAGSPIILIPGLACGAWTWNGVIPTLAKTHTVYALTLAGFDGRPAPRTPPSFAGFDGDLQSLIASRRMAKPALIGHSLGGTLAIAYAEAHPTDISAVVAVDGLPVFPTAAGMTAEQRAANAQQLGAGVRAQSDADFLAYEERFMKMAGVTDLALADQLAALSARSDRATVAAWLQADVAADFRPDLGKITVPLTEIGGWSRGEPYSSEQKAAFYRGLLAGAPKGDVVMIEDAKHFVMFDQPERFATALQRTLSVR